MNLVLRIIVGLIIVLVCLNPYPGPADLALPCLAGDKNGTDKQYCDLNFDCPLSLGQLRALPPGEPFGWPTGGPLIGEARGRVRVKIPILLMAYETLFDHADVLAKLPADAIGFLYLDNTGGNDDFIATIKTLTGLKKLSAIGSDITDKGVAQLSVFKDICDLRLGSSLIQGKTLGELKTMTKLRRIGLNDNQLRPQAFVELGKLQSLEVLELSRVAATDAEIMSLPVLPKLYRLGLQHNSAITGRCLKHLAQFPSLLYLHLDDTSVRPMDLLVFKGTKLRAVEIDGTLAGAAELKKVRALCPQISITPIRFGAKPKVPTDLFAPLH